LPFSTREKQPNSDLKTGSVSDFAHNADIPNRPQGNSFKKKKTAKQDSAGDFGCRYQSELEQIAKKLQLK